ncbi:5'-methylthioadenosine/S-adenosylhomocysteine nucleosidase [Limoniibacter endophyticus]|uniref:5'-methylthioadenosine/S-adenosylhomocysteine nucleosidase n=1 Tax=Limoniibacter endophyticus TaxID=1565040 RepID=A0A8J3DHA4_9HYPH|nr:5'-methylthioadenosine/S-adenosylhomocysteine nucleosidase [Limoniibacter endophyticus]GHC70637.1 5'-methylthioadenosine/S-adenosylhomocysteine nucleosidase [Limoniibacter endophyticus]
MTFQETIAGAGTLRTIGNSSVLYVMAVDAEYGPHLRERIDPLMTGVGPIEAAIIVTERLARLKAAGSLPDLLVSLGSAGSRVLEQTKVYQASHVSWRDMDASALGFEKGCTPFIDLPAMVALDLVVEGLPQASLSTGANVVSGADYDSIDAHMVDMETFATLRACQRFGVKLIALRGISDGKAELTHVDDWREYLHVVDKNLAGAVEKIEQAVAEGLLSR